jgi:hypothetical protein
MPSTSVIGGWIVTEDRERERARAKAVEEGERQAEEIRARTASLMEELKDETINQLGVIYGGLILICLYMVQPFLVAPSLDLSATISVIAFAVAMPLLAALVLVNRQERFRHRRTSSVIVTIVHSFAQSAAFVGIVAGFWHITWIAGVTFLVVALVAIGVHSAGWWRLESSREPASSRSFDRSG